MALPDSLTESTEATAGAPAAEGFAGRFGLDPWLLAAQAVNFLIVLYVLNRFVFRPLLKTIRTRTTILQKGLADAEEAAAARAAAAAEKVQVLAAARAEAGAALRNAEAEAHRVREAVVRTAEEEASAIHDRAEREADILRARVVAQATGDAGELVVDTVEQVLATKIGAKERAAYLDVALRKLKKG